MKRKYTLVRFVLGTLVIILAISVLIGSLNNKVLMPYLIACFGLFEFFTGLYLYRKNKKADGILLILCGIFTLGVVFL